MGRREWHEEVEAYGLSRFCRDHTPLAGHMPTQKGDIFNEYQEYIIATCNNKSDNLTKYSREKIDNDLYLGLRTIYHYERSIANRWRSLCVSLQPEGEKVVEEIEANSYEKVTGNAVNMPEEEFASLLRTAEQLHQVLGVTDRVNKQTK